MCLVVCYTIAMFFACVFACQPIRKAYDIRIEDGHCTSQIVLNIAASLWNLVTDVVVLLLALHLVQWWRLSILQRWGLCGFLAIGCLYAS